MVLFSETMNECIFITFLDFKLTRGFLLGNIFPESYCTMKGPYTSSNLALTLVAKHLVGLSRTCRIDSKL